MWRKKEKILENCQVDVKTGCKTMAISNIGEGTFSFRDL